MSLERVRILHLIATKFVGGPEKQILHHALSAASSLQEIWLASFRDFPARPELLERADRAGLPTIEFSSGRFRLQTLLELMRALKKNQISLLCTHGYKANLLGWAASRLTGCPQIAFARGWTGENWRIKLYERMDRFILRWTDWVVCVSRPLAEQIARKRTRRMAPQFIPNCALLPFENAVSLQDRLALRRSLGIVRDSFCLCAVGRLSPEKGHRYLLEAIPKLIDRIPRLLVILLGEGREHIELRRKAEELGIRKYVLFAGFKKDIRPWIQACDVLVNPSLTEGIPNVVLEAMALAVPVVATGVGGVPDLIQNGKSGLLVPPEKPESLADAIYSIYANPAKALDLTQNARFSLQEYSPEKQRERLLEIYSRAMTTMNRKMKDSARIWPNHLGASATQANVMTRIYTQEHRS